MVDEAVRRGGAGRGGLVLHRSFLAVVWLRDSVLEALEQHWFEAVRLKQNFCVKQNFIQDELFHLFVEPIQVYFVGVFVFLGLSARGLPHKKR